ncbi:hypothetical protein ACN47E_001283 [Coniothyrium glycines]
MCAAVLRMENDFFAKVSDRLLQPPKPKSHLLSYFEALKEFEEPYRTPSPTPPRSCTPISSTTTLSPPTSSTPVSVTMPSSTTTSGMTTSSTTISSMTTSTTTTFDANMSAPTTNACGKRKRTSAASGSLGVISSLPTKRKRLGTHNAHVAMFAAPPQTPKECSKPSLKTPSTTSPDGPSPSSTPSCARGAVLARSALQNASGNTKESVMCSVVHCDTMSYTLHWIVYSVILNADWDVSRCTVAPRVKLYREG